MSVVIKCINLIYLSSLLIIGNCSLYIQNIVVIPCELVGEVSIDAARAFLQITVYASGDVDAAGR
jgi:hypothetical protein